MNFAFNELGYNDIPLLTKWNFCPFILISLLFYIGLKEILFLKNKVPWALGFRKNENQLYMYSERYVG